MINYQHFSIAQPYLHQPTWQISQIPTNKYQHLVTLAPCHPLNCSYHRPWSWKDQNLWFLSLHMLYHLLKEYYLKRWKSSWIKRDLLIKRKVQGKTDKKGTSELKLSGRNSKHLNSWNKMIWTLDARGESSVSGCKLPFSKNHLLDVPKPPLWAVGKK